MLPPGISLGLYIRFTASALFSMLIGAQVVHSYYRPLQDLDKYIDEELKKLPEDQRQKVKLDLH